MLEEFYNKKILIIEDHETLRSSLHFWLTTLYPEMEIYEASTGEVGFSLVQSIKPDLALIDIGLPGINGLEVTKKIKDANLKTEVIVLTILEGLNYQYESFFMGAATFINKKDMYSALPGAIQSILAKQNN